MPESSLDRRVETSETQTSPAEQKLRHWLREQRHLSERELEALDAELQDRLAERAERDAAVLYSVDSARGLLRVSRYADGELLKEIPLVEDAMREPGSELWARKLIGIRPEDGRVLSNQALPAQPALLVGARHSYLCGDDFASQEAVAESELWRDPRSYKGKSAQGPWDLQISPGHRLLFVSNRAAGTVTVISHASHELLATLQVRGPGSRKAINLAIDEARDLAYLTDNETSSLKVLNLLSLKLRDYQPGFGVLGQLVLGRDPRYLCLLTLKPAVALKYIDTETFETIKDLSLRGKLLSKDSDAITDQMLMSADRSQLLVVSYRDEPERFTPTVTVYDSDELRPVLRYVLDGLPGLLVNERLNPFQDQAPDLAGLARFKGLIDAAALETLAQEAMVAAPVAGDLDLGQRQYEQLQPLRKQVNVGEVKLPPEAEDALQAMLLARFERHTGLPLRDYRVEMQKLEELAFTIRHELEQRDEVQLDKFNYFFQHYSVKLQLRREALLEMLEWRHDSRQAPPYRCPRCAVSLMGHWQCSHCDFQLIKPEWVRRRAQASVEAETLALPGELMLPQGEELLLVNGFESLSWRYALANSGLSLACDVRVLPSQQLLVTDPESARVVELSPNGQLIWEAKLTLRQPRMATWYQRYGGERILIVDSGLRQVIELNRLGEVLWRFGGSDERQLVEPVCVQRSHRQSYFVVDAGARQVLEIDDQGQLLASYGAELGLVRPIYARLRYDELLLIVDAGSARILLLDAEGRIAYEQDWKPENLPSLQALDEVVWATETRTGEVLLSDGCRLLRCHPIERRINGMIKPDQLPLRPDVSASADTLFIAPNPIEQRQAFLATQAIYRDISPAALLLIAKGMQPVAARAGEKIVVEGDKGTAMFTILQGTVQVFKSGSDDAVASLHSGDTFGEMSLYLLEDRSATVIAKTDCHLLRLDHGPFRKAMNAFPELNTRFKDLCQRRKQILHQRKVGRYQEAVEQLKARMALRRLRALPIFNQIGPELFDALKDKLYCVSYPRKHFVFRHKAPVKHLYFVSRGSVEVLGENERLMTTLNEGEVFGEIGLLLDRPRTASVRTKGYCDIYQLDKEALFQVLRRFPSLDQHLRELAEARFARDAGVTVSAEATAPVSRTRLSARTSGPRPTDSPQLFFLGIDARQVVGVDAQGNIPWVFGGDRGHQVLNPRWISEGDGSLLVTDAGYNRVLEIDVHSGKVLHEFGGADLELFHPAAATRTHEGTILICDQGSESIVEIDPLKPGRPRWRFSDPYILLSPHSAELTPEGTLLYADEALHLVSEVDREGHQLWSYGEALYPGDEPGRLNAPAFATRLANGNTLIADTGNDRVIELSPAGELVWRFSGTPAQPLHKPQKARRLANGNTQILDDWQSRWLEVDPAGRVRWTCQIEDLGADEAASEPQLAVLEV